MIKERKSKNKKKDIYIYKGKEYKRTIKIIMMQEKQEYTGRIIKQEPRKIQL